MDDALELGLLGLLQGAMQWKLSDETRRMAEEAEARKQQRLLEIQMAAEGRANAEWERRFELENKAARTAAAEERAYDIDDREDQQAHEMGEIGMREQAAARELQSRHDLTLQEIKAREQAARGTLLVQEGLTRTRPQQPGQIEGVYGDDGQFYPVGTPMPAGVRPTVGFGATNLGTRGTNIGGNTNSLLQGISTPQQPQKTIVRRGTLNGRAVVQYADGSVEYAD